MTGQRYSDSGVLAKIISLVTCTRPPHQPHSMLPGLTFPFSPMPSPVLRTPVLLPPLRSVAMLASASSRQRDLAVPQHYQVRVIKPS
jgi:hypothetical protein